MVIKYSFNALPFQRVSNRFQKIAKIEEVLEQHHRKLDKHAALRLKKMCADAVWMHSCCVAEYQRIVSENDGEIDGKRLSGVSAGVKATAATLPLNTAVIRLRSGVRTGRERGEKNPGNIRLIKNWCIIHN